MFLLALLAGVLSMSAVLGGALELVSTNGREGNEWWLPRP